MKCLCFLYVAVLALLLVLVSGCDNGEFVPRISEYPQGETVSVETATGSWSQSVSVVSTTVVACMNGECEVYHEEEVCQKEGRL